MLAIALVSVLLPFLPAEAQKTIAVPKDQATIQAAINAAAAGDSVVISPGVYFESIDYLGKAITLTGSGPGVILDGSGLGPVIQFHQGEGRSAVLSNVTVRNGASTSSLLGGGIYIDHASPSIENNTIEGNAGCGIGVYFGAPLLRGNILSGNSAGREQGCAHSTALFFDVAGGGIVLVGAASGPLQTEIIGNTIEQNTVVYQAAGISALSAGNIVISNNVISGNTSNDQGAGMLVSGDSAATILQNLIVQNTINPTIQNEAYAAVGAGINLDLTNGAEHPYPTVIVGNTIANNQLLHVPGTHQNGSQVFAVGYYNSISFWNNLIVGEGSQTPIDCLANLVTPVAPPKFDHNDVFSFGLVGSPYSGSCLNQTSQNGNISLDPKFAGSMQGAAFELLPGSPAIDSGNNFAPAIPQLDFLNQPRIQNATGTPVATIDLGVYEAPGIPGVVPSPPPPPVTSSADLTIVAAPALLTLRTEHHGNIAITLRSSSGITGPVTLSCASLPAHASCTFARQSLTVPPGTAPSTVLTVDTSDVKGFARNRTRWEPLRAATLAVFLLPCTLLLGKRRTRSMALLCLVCFVLTGLAACSGKYPLSTAPGTYTITLIADAPGSATQATASFSLVVTP